VITLQYKVQQHHPSVHSVVVVLQGAHNSNKLKPNIFEGLQLLKSAYRNGHILATTQAGCHTENSITFIDSSSEGEVEVD
jgi:hypothetical protein